jgi:lactoylglutathione lyase
MRTLHVGLRVEHLDRSLAFYRALGFEVVGTVPETEFGRLTMLKLPEDEYVSIELVHDPNGGPVDPRGINHLVIQVDSMDSAAEMLAAAGIDVESSTRHDDADGLWTAWLTDPDGYRIELVQWPRGHPAGMFEGDFADPGTSD